MFLQEFVRGIGGLSRPEVESILQTAGLSCAALRTGHAASIDEAENLLGQVTLNNHRHNHATVGPESPYISVSAGTFLEGDSVSQVNEARYAFDTALEFAVVMPSTDGSDLLRLLLPTRTTGRKPRGVR